MHLGLVVETTDESISFIQSEKLLSFRPLRKVSNFVIFHIPYLQGQYTRKTWFNFPHRPVSKCDFTVLRGEFESTPEPVTLV